MNLKKRLVTLAAFLGIAAVPAAALAFPGRPGAYLSFFMGGSAPQDSVVTSHEFNPVTTKNTVVRFDPGVDVGGTAGYDFGLLRMECEMSYKQGEMVSAVEQSFGTRYVNVDGNAGAFGMLFNGFFDLHNWTPVTPYFGGGVGFASVHLSDAKGVDSSSGALNGHIFRSDDDTVFAYQVGGGVEVALNPRMSLDLAYRYFATSSATLKGNWPSYTNLKLESNNATAGLRLKF